MKTCVSSYSFCSYMKETGTSQKDIIKKAKELGFEAIEYIDLDVPNGMSEAQFASVLREESEKYSLPIVNYTVSADFLNCDSLEEEIERVCRKVDIAKILGAGGMRHDATVGYKGKERSFKTFDDALPILAECCGCVTRYAKEKGIETMVENHGQFCQESERVERLIGEVGDKNFGWLLDIGNFLCADDEPQKAAGRAAPFIKHVHVKDFHIKSGSEFNPGEGFFMTRGGTFLRGAILGQGNVPVLGCMRVVKNSGYDGYVSIEFEGMEDNIKALKIGLDNLNAMIKAL